MKLESHEKFIAFCLLGASLVGIVVMIYLRPPSSAITDNGAAMAIINTIVGALTLAFGGAAGALFKISNSDKKEIGEATADAITNGPPLDTRVTNTNKEPVPIEDAPTPPSGGSGAMEPAGAQEELPAYARE
jgi:hypothetical protein